MIHVNNSCNNLSVDAGIPRKKSECTQCFRKSLFTAVEGRSAGHIYCPLCDHLVFPSTSKAYLIFQPDELKFPALLTLLDL